MIIIPSTIIIIIIIKVFPNRPKQTKKRGTFLFVSVVSCSSKLVLHLLTSFSLWVSSQTSFPLILIFLSYSLHSLPSSIEISSSPSDSRSSLCMSGCL
mmetsp:Transcript_13228/g.37578  ORF Transcript_13228/g.37578 Transcript_13228/m.37578 type:complete len:98 (+) Transcript_13228:1194-1487(+)